MQRRPYFFEEKISNGRCSSIVTIFAKKGGIMREILLDTTLDSIKLLPFLLLTYLAMEALEHSTGGKTVGLIKKADKTGPVIGGLLGVMPQCGFSAAASSLYAGRVISLGTIFAVFFSTSDEMLPILISEDVPVKTIIKILGTKVVIAIVSGFIVELIYWMFIKKKHDDMDIHVVCEEEHCDCRDGVFKAAFKHTVKIFVYIFVISLILNGIIAWVGEDTLAQIFSDIPVVSELVAGLVGLIPNCASSVVITELYLQKVIGAGAMMTGLLVNAGVGMLVLWRLNRHPKENIAIMAGMYIMAVIWGVLIEYLGVIF